jgi:hypothetical protein
MVRRQIARRVECDRLLGPHHHGIDEAAHQHDQRQHHVHDADLLMVETREPFGPQIAPSAEPGDERRHAKCAEHGDQRASHCEVAVKWQGVNGQLAEHVIRFRARMLSRFALELHDACSPAFSRLAGQAARSISRASWNSI